MNNDEMTPTDQLNYALRLIRDLPNALTLHIAPMGQIRQRLEELEGRTCTGNVHWRDNNTPGKTAKLYVLHGIDQDCPIHGQPSQGERIRSYIGNKPDKISDALAAIERNTERRKLQRDLKYFQETISRVAYRIKNIYWILGHTTPEPDQETPLSKDPSTPTTTE